MSIKQTQVNEIVKCGKDPAYFINKYLKIEHPLKGLIPFATYPFQDKCLTDFNDHRFNIILKSRQLGISTIVAAYAIWQALFYKNKNILIIATKLAVAQNFVKKVKVALQALPPWLMLSPITSNNKQQVVLGNGSSIKAIPTSEDAGRSEALSLLIIDEAAFVRNFDELWTGLYPTLSTGGRAIILSTPNGVGGQYYDLWMGAEQHTNVFNPIKLSWDVHPERDHTWFEEETKNMTTKQIAQELLCDFAASGDTFFQNDDLDWVRSRTKAPIEMTGPNQDVWVWKYPREGHKYVLSADVSRGDGADSSVFHIINVNTQSVDVEYRGKLTPDNFSQLVYDWARRYNKALICPENNTYGYMVLSKLNDLGYQHFHFDKDRDKYDFNYSMNKSEYIAKAGFSTQKDSRAKILSNLEEAVRNKRYEMHSLRAYDEFKTFVWLNNRPAAMKDHHDDIVMSLAIGLWIADKFGAQLSSTESTTANEILKGMKINSNSTANSVLSPYYNNSLSKTINPFLPIPMSDSIIDTGESKKISALGDFSWLVR
jgi:hypothetical protein